MKDLNVTREMIEAVVLAQLYREEPVDKLRKVVIRKMTSSELNQLYHDILTHPDYQKVKQETLELEKETNIEDDSDTIMLVYNKMMKDAQAQGKYEVATRILSEIRKLKAIDDAEQKFEVIITVKPPKASESDRATESDRALANKESDTTSSE